MDVSEIISVRRQLDEIADQIIEIHREVEHMHNQYKEHGHRWSHRRLKRWTEKCDELIIRANELESRGVPLQHKLIRGIEEMGVKMPSGPTAGADLMVIKGGAARG